MAEAKMVVCLGELLIDFFCTDIDVDLKRGERFVKKAGGAPANVSAAITRLGGRAAFAGKVGADPFGIFLKQTLEREKVDTSMLLMDTDYSTTLAFVSLEASGERDFVFNRGADLHVRFEELDLTYIRQSSILHFGSATAMLADPFRHTYFEVMKVVRSEGKLISFDPNYRKDLWHGREEEFITLSRFGIESAFLVKVSEEELRLITGIFDKDQALDILHQMGATLIAVTLGKDGTYISNGTTRLLVPSIPVQSIDSTGAGDAFVGALLFKISGLEQPMDIAGDNRIFEEFTAFANKVGALVCTKIGAIDSLPVLEEVENV